MPSFTAQSLIDRAAAIADIEDNFVSPGQWLTWLSVERSAQALAAARGGWTLNQVSTQTTPATDTWTLTGDFLALIGVWEVDSSGRTRPLIAEDFQSNFRQTVGGPITGPATRFSITDAGGVVTVHFFPRPTSGTYMAALVGTTPAFATVLDTITLPAGLEERLVLGMARRALIKEESDVTDISKLIALEDQRLEEFVWARIISSVAKVRNVDHVERGWGSDLTYPPPTDWVWL